VRTHFESTACDFWEKLGKIEKNIILTFFRASHNNADNQKEMEVQRSSVNQSTQNSTMNSFQRYTCKATIIGLCLACTSGAYAQISSINSAVINPRVFNDYPGATGTYINGYPGAITLGESGEYTTNSGGFANKDTWEFSNNGSTPYAFLAGDTAFKASMTLDVTGATTVDNEAGFVIPNANASFPGGDMQFIADPQSGFLGFFGGPGFWNSGFTYVAGADITMQILYYQTGTTGNMQFSVTDGTTVTSPVQSWTGNLVGDVLGAYYQLQGIDNSTGPGTSGQALFDDISITVPEPTTLAFLGVGIGSLLLRRCRK
jgi:hypothetical protein